MSGGNQQSLSVLGGDDRGRSGRVCQPCQSPPGLGHCSAKRDGSGRGRTSVLKWYHSFRAALDEQVSPMAHVAVVGIGGLAHMVLQFANAWGCEVTALTTDLTKAHEAMGFGAHNVMLLEEFPALAGRFALVINTANQPLDWSAVFGSLAPRGRLHQLGAVLQPIQVGALDLISFRRSITGSPTSSPASLRKMMKFCVRHAIKPQVEHLPFDQVNQAIDRLHRGDVRSRFVLDQTP